MPGVSVDVDIADTSDLPTEGYVTALVETVLSGENKTWSSVGVVLSGHETVTALNVEWLSHDFDTDVLSFLVDDGPDGLEGEVYVDVETARERHAEFETTVQDEICRYIVHGVLHLAGHDDATAEGSRLMRALEDRYLSLAPQ